MGRDINLGWPKPTPIPYDEFETYAALPAAADNIDATCLVKTATGTWPFSRKRAGLWRSDGVSWTRMGAYPTAANLGLGTSDSPTFAGVKVVANNAPLELVDDSGNIGRIKVGNTWLTIEVDPDGTELSSSIVFKVDGSEKGRLRWDGRLGIGTTSPKSMLHVVGLPPYADNAAAITGGLTAGAFYRDNSDPDKVCVVH